MLQTLKNLDLFGKEPDLYYKGNQKKNIMGRSYSNLIIYNYLFCLLFIQNNSYGK